VKLEIKRWKGLQPGEMELIDKMHSEGLSPYAWSNGPGDTYAAHTHHYDKVLYVVRGSIDWLLPETGDRIETFSGDRIELPAGTSHAAVVGNQGVTCLEARRD
jgi:quercetin dioxygenase-like cupin family protein